MTTDTDQTPPAGFDLSGEQSRFDQAAQQGIVERPEDLIADAEAVSDDEADDELGDAIDNDDNAQE